MPEIKKVLKQDFEKIYPLLLRFNETRLSKEDWEKIFERRCDDVPEYFGFYLEDSGQAVGYVGAIFSKRIINTKEHLFANLTSWIVLDDYKNHSISLLFKILRLKETTITALTPNNTAYEIYSKLGFDILEKSQYFIFPSLFGTKKIKSEYDIKTIQSKLERENRHISKDHAEFNNIQTLFVIDGETVFSIYKKAKKKHLSFVEMHYCSNLPLFNKHAGQIVRKISVRFKVVGLIVESRFIKGSINALHTKQALKNPRRMFRGEEKIKEHIDILYSELYFLHQ